MRCAGQPISSIEVRTEEPVVGGARGRYRPIARLIRDLHDVTRPSVVRRFVVFKPGEPCREIARAETERILRAQPFIADARVRAFDDTAGTVRIEVVTVDEVSLVIGGAVRGPFPVPRALTLGNANMGGLAIDARGNWRDGGFYRDVYGGRFTHYQILGRPYQFSAQGERLEHGGNWTTQFTHPFLTDLQRVAWVSEIGARRGFVEFTRPDDAPTPALELSRRFATVGGILRIGEPGRLSLFGASISREEEVTGDLPVRITKEGIFEDTSAALVGRYTEHRAARANALWGVRNIEFVRVTGFDALAATQDIPKGFQLGTMLGRSLSVFGSQDDDIFVSADLYAANGSQRSLFAVELKGEGRSNYDTNKWDGILGGGRAAFYFKPSERRTLRTSVEWAAGWRQRVPFQLTLRNPEGGVRGYEKLDAGGARRVVWRLEDRRYFGNIAQTAGIGGALFVDAGRLWAGDAPFGVDTKVKTSVGLAVLGAFPPRSKRTWRLDLAVPLTAGAGRRLGIGLSNQDQTRVFWREPGDWLIARERSVPSSIFRWP